MDVDIDSDGLIRERIASGESVERPSLPTATEIRRRMFTATPEDVTHQILDRILHCRAKGLPIDFDGLPSEIVVAPPPSKLPRGLQPWETTLKSWRRATNEVRTRDPLLKVAHKYRDDVPIRPPMLPAGFGVYFLSVGVDPGPETTAKGHTGLLLVATPPGWEPPLRASLRGPRGEVYTVRLDALVMRVPAFWWDSYALGALKDGCLYFIPPSGN